MEKSTVIEQLCIFADSLKQISTALSQLQCSFIENGSDCAHCLMVSSRRDIMHTLVELNKCLLSINTTDNIYSGSFVLAPRFFQGIMCWDLAVVTSIIERDNSSIGENSTELVSICLDTLTAKVTQIISIAWMRPQNKYELHSSAIEFTPAQLRSSSQALQLHCAQETALCSIDSIKHMLYLDRDLGESMGLWCPGVVVCIPSGSGAEQQQVALRSQRSGTTNAGFIVTRSLLLTEVCPLPGTRLADSRGSEQLQEGAVDSSAVADNSNSDTDSSQNTAADIHEGVKCLPSYLQRWRSKHASSSSLASANSDPQSGTEQGSWERHTKGFGSKILRRMGYSRERGGGLGRDGQGIVEPVQAAPSQQHGRGLSSDSSCSPSSLLEDCLLQRRGAEIRAAIVAGFNSKQGKRPPQHRGAGGRGSQYNKAHKSSTASMYKPTQPGSMFGFINRMESAHTAGGVSMKLPASASQSKPPNLKSAALRKNVF